MAGIHEALSNIMKGVDNIPALDRHPQGWNYRGMESIYRAMHTMFVEQQVVCIPNVKSIERFTRETNGGLWYHSIVTVGYILLHADGSSIEGTAIGEGSSNVDKATAGALTDAHKRFLIQTFIVPESGEQDTDTTNPPPTTTTQPQGPPPPAPNAPSAGQDDVHTVQSVDIKRKAPEGSGKTWVLHTITTDKGQYDTFSESHATLADHAFKTQSPVCIKYSVDAKYRTNNLEEIEPADAPAPEPPVEPAPAATVEITIASYVTKGTPNGDAHVVTDDKGVTYGTFDADLGEQLKSLAATNSKAILRVDNSSGHAVVTHVTPDEGAW